MSNRTAGSRDDCQLRPELVMSGPRLIRGMNDLHADVSRPDAKLINF